MCRGYTEEYDQAATCRELRAWERETNELGIQHRMVFAVLEAYVSSKEGLLRKQPACMRVCDGLRNVAYLYQFFKNG